MKCIRPFVFGVLALLLVMGSSHGQSAPSRLPPIRQVWLEVAQTSAILGTGSWSIVPREIFNNTLHRAEVASNAGRRPPWLLSAQYEAQVADLELSGSVELSLYNPHELASWARISPWSLPLKSNDMTSLDNIQAMSERTLGIHVGPKQNERTKLSWTAQGEERPDGRWFSLQLPPCPVASLQVTVPTPDRLDWPGHRQHLSGPFPVEGTNSRRWVLQLGGEVRQDVQFVVRQPAEQRRQAWTEGRLDADFVVTSTEVQLRYEIDLQRWHDRLRSLTLDIPDDVQIKSVTLRQLGTDLLLAWQMSGPRALAISLPESVDQRVTVVVDATCPRKPGQRLRFDLPQVRGVISMKPTIRVVTDPAQPMVDWKWGDYYPIQGPQKDRFQDSPAEVLTLAPRLVKGTQELLAPSANQSSRASELSYQQDIWWRLGDRLSQVVVRSQVTMLEGQPEILSWHVPDGWVVTQVTSDTAASIRAWTWRPQQPLEVQLPVNLAPSKVITLTIRLEPAAKDPLSEEPRVLALPGLQPLVPGKFSGWYAVTLERSGLLQPPSLVVLKAPGPVASWPENRATIWPALLAIVPDLCWQVRDPLAQGAVQIQSWPATVSAQLSTILEDHRVVYRIKMLPVAGQVTHFPIQFSSPVGELQWRSSTTGVPVPKWSPDGNGGVLNWPSSLRTACELQASIPWNQGSPVPLISSSWVAEATYYQGQGWLPLPVSESTKPDDIGWKYNHTATSPVPRKAQTTHLALIDPRITTRIEGDFAESEYLTGIEPHADSVFLQLQKSCEILGMEIDGKPMPLKDRVELAPSNKNSTVRIQYRSKLNSLVGLTAWQPGAPVWNVKATPAPTHRIIRDRPVKDVWGLSIENGEHEVLHDANVVLWMNRHTLFVLAIMLGAGVWWAASAFHRRSLLFIALVLCAVGSFLLPDWRMLILSAAVGVILAHRSLVTSFFRRQFSWSMVLMLALAGTGILAQADRPAELVYLIPAEKGSTESPRVMVNAALWTQLQNLAKLKSAGANQRWWISQVHTRGTFQGQRLQLSSTWTVTTETDEPVEIPLPIDQLPETVRLDSQQIQPQLAVSAFGWKQFAIPIRKAGRHELQIGWEQAIIFHQKELTTQIKLPGAPMQSLRFEALPADILLQGPGVRRILSREQKSVPTIEAGFAPTLTVSWPRDNTEKAQTTVDVGILYEHRVHQSLVHAVLAYHVEKGAMDEMTLEFPAGWKVKQLSVVGDLQGTVTPRLKKWRVTSSELKQRLLVQLQRPVERDVNLFLEMLVPRDSQDDAVPLYGIDTPEVAQNHHFVAYVTDGIAGKPMSALEPVAASSLEFARAWLPTISSLPASAIGRSRPLTETPVRLKLSPLADNPIIQTRTELMLNAQDAVYQQHVEILDEHKPVVYLKGLLEPGLVVSDVTGDQVVRWQQTSPRGSEPTSLSIWFVQNREGKPVQCTITSRQSLEAGDRKKQARLFRIQWESASESSRALMIRSDRAATVNTLPASALVPLHGPWRREDIIAGYLMPANPPDGATLEVHNSVPMSMPKAESRWITQSGETLWQLTVTAGKDERLPALIEFAVPQGKLEQHWQMEGAVALAVRPSRGPDNNLIWSVQSRKPMNQLVITCHPLRDSSGKPVVPAVSFPAWPGLAVSLKE